MHIEKKVCFVKFLSKARKIHDGNGHFLESRVLKIEVVFSRVFAAGILVLDLLLVVVHVGHLQPAAEVL